MENVEEQILTYPHRSQEGRREIEAFVEEHPEWAPLLRDVRALEGVAQARRRIDVQEGPSEALIATYVTVKHLHPEDVSPRFGEAFRRLEDRIETDETLREQADVMRRRLEAAEAEVDPAAQFEELTGHDLSVSMADGSASAPDTERAREPTPTLLESFYQLTAPVQWVGTALALLLGVYGVLYGVSVATQSPLERLATIEVSEQVVGSYAPGDTRGGSADADTVRAQDLYLEALSILRTARTSTLGLFPGYDADKIARAERLLRDVVEREGSGSFLALEAQFYLGKTHLAQQQADQARAQFENVVRNEGRRADDARRILDALPDAADTTR
jgi:hypothetical protein